MNNPCVPFVIREDDLVELERGIPIMAHHLEFNLAEMKDSPNGNALRTQIRRVQRILSDIRFGYGPASSKDVEIVELPPNTGADEK